MDYTQNRMITNKDSKGGSDASNCAYNGCCLRKGAQESWRTTLYNDNPVILMRYADVLLMYAEAKIELGRLTLLSLLASMMSVPVLMAPPVHKPTTIRPSRQPIRQHCAKCSVVSVVWSCMGKSALFRLASLASV